MEALSSTKIRINCYRGILDDIKVLRKEVEQNRTGMSDQDYIESIHDLDECESECLEEISSGEKAIKKIRSKNPKGFEKGGQSW